MHGEVGVKGKRKKDAAKESNVSGLLSVKKNLAKRNMSHKSDDWHTHLFPKHFTYKITSHKAYVLITENKLGL